MGDKIVYSSILGVLLALNIAVLIVSVMIYCYLNSSYYDNLTNIAENWKKGPVLDLLNNCMDPDSRISNSQYEGTERGCYCSGLLTFTSLYKGQCNRRSYTCINVMPTPSIPLDKWKGVNLCGTKTLNYFQSNIVAPGDNCSENFKKCGVIDNLKNELCVPVDSPCPINDIIFQNTTLPQIPNYKSKDGGEGTTVYYGNTNSKGSVLVELMMGEKGICSNLYYKALNRPEYALSKYHGRESCTEELGGYYINPFFKTLDTWTTLNLYKDNGIMPVLLMLPEFHPQELNVQVKLLERGYIGVKRECISKFSPDGSSEINTLLITGDQTEGLSNTAFIGMIVSIIFSVISIILIIVGLVIGVNDDNTHEIFFITNSFVSAIFMAVCSGIYFYMMSVVDKVNFNIKFIGLDNCSDSITNASILSYSKSYDLFFPMINFLGPFCIIIVCGCIVGGVVSVIYRH